MTLHEVLSKLPKATKTGSGYSANCPAHEDHTPSLSVSEGQDGKVLLHCHAGCSLDAICQALAIAPSDLFAGNPPSRGQAPVAETVYPYRDASGKLMYEVVRYWPKTFKQRRPDPVHPGQRIWGRGGVAPLLYRLPEVREAVATGEVIYICEGEKDVEVMVQNGFSATCNSGGAGKWPIDQSPHLKSAPVVIIADKDTPGRNHADEVAQSLSGVASSVRVIECPDIGGRSVKDAADFFAAGGSAEQLQQIAESAPKWTPRGSVSSIPDSADEAGHSVKSAIISGNIVFLPQDGKCTTTESANLLYTKLAPTLQFFIQGDAVTVLGRDDCNKVYLSPLHPSRAISEMENHVTFMKHCQSSNGDHAIKLSLLNEQTAKALLNASDKKLLPRINNVINFPVLVELPDGTLTECTSGYQSQAKILVSEAIKPEVVTIEEAVRALRGLFGDFQFQSASDESRAIAMLLTPSLKIGGLISRSVPIAIVEADQSQAGKTLMLKAITGIHGEKLNFVTQRTGGVGSFDESLAQALLRGRPFIALDNLRGEINTQFLEAFLTADGRFPCRAPGRPETEVDASSYFVMMTSNSVKTTVDLANRACFIRIRKRENAEFGPLLEDIQARLPFYQGCLMAVAREWHAKGKPEMGSSEHALKSWAKPLDWIVQHMFGMASLMDGHKQAQARTSDPTLGFLREICLKVKERAELGVPLSATNIVELAIEEGIQIPGTSTYGNPDEDRAAKVLGSRLKKHFSSTPALDLDGFTVTRADDKHRRQDGNGYSPIKTYVVSEQKGTATTTTATTTTPLSVTGK